MTYEKLAPTLLENIMQIHNFKQSHIAKPLGITVPTLSDFLRGKRPLKFGATLYLHNRFFKEDTRFIFEMFNSYQRKKDYIRPAIEYLSINYHLEELEKMLERIKDYDSFDDIYNVYSLVMEYSKGISDKEEMLKNIKRMCNEISDDESDLIALLYILEANIYGVNAEYKSLYRIADEVNYYIEQTEDEFVKKSLKSRLNEVICQSELFHKNNTNEARTIAIKIISENVCAKHVSYGYYIIGTSYMFQDYEKARENLIKSEILYKNSGHIGISKSIRQNVYVLDSYWGVDIDNLYDDMDLSEKAHRLAKRGEEDKSLRILNDLPDTPFRNYYRGLASKDFNSYFKSLGQFIKQGGYFFAQLPLKELESNADFKPIAHSIYYN